MKYTKSIIALLSVIIIIFACGEDPVKVTTGTINGVVYDYSSGTTIGNANIVTQPPSSSVTSDTLTGEFKILHVEPGIYHVRAQKSGYDSAGVDISVIADDKTIADIALRVDSTFVDTTEAP
ncbi:MAG: carboxypeptidase regulatory-like domain-containing protein [Calditrichaeota bacterium]|nr:MAG: carboxypeptidase regulatory-like domain-containing protein [Calditrichota bacterium]MBL1206861.1 carboxypeptidase regulatory-like domain-containing protein [Calditrichota bacterium]NOG46688.1 carboxypeptidase regulatory-like domain-containing protein [Calditrichota bacterium]